MAAPGYPELATRYLSELTDCQFILGGDLADAAQVLLAVLGRTPLDLPAGRLFQPGWHFCRFTLPTGIQSAQGIYGERRNESRDSNPGGNSDQDRYQAVQVIHTQPAIR